MTPIEEVVATHQTRDYANGIVRLATSALGLGRDIRVRFFQEMTDQGIYWMSLDDPYQCHGFISSRDDDWVAVHVGQRSGAMLHTIAHELRHLCQDVLGIPPGPGAELDACEWARRFERDYADGLEALCLQFKPPLFDERFSIRREGCGTCAEMMSHA